MWQQNYAPLQGSLGLSALVAAFPIFVLLYLLGVRRKPSCVAGLSGLAATIVVALFLYQMPVVNVIGAVTYGGLYGLFPIGWVGIRGGLAYRGARANAQL